MRRQATGWLAMAVFAAGMLLCQPATVVAQSTDSAQDVVNVNDPNLKLTDQQKQALKSINEQRRKELEALRNDSSLTGQQKAQRAQEINRAANEQIRGTLNPEQYERWQRGRRDRLEDRADRREQKRDRAEDVRDRREDRRDAQHDGGVRDRREDRRDAREDKRDRREDVRDRKENRRDRRRPPR